MHESDFTGTFIYELSLGGHKDFDSNPGEGEVDA